MLTVTSLQNPRVKYAVRLRDRRDRDREQKLLIEGYRQVKRAVDNHYPLEELFFCPEMFQGENEPALIDACAETECRAIRTTPLVFRKIAYRDRPEGLLAVAPQRHLSLDALRLSRTPLLLVAEAIEKPGNLGTMLRASDAAGADGIILCDRCTDLFNPNVVRASIGTVFSVPVVEAPGGETLDRLQRLGIRILAATPHADELYTEADMVNPVAIAVGTEQYGLSKEWLSRADVHVRIPMLGQVDSLNVATASALLLYEAVRQRASGRG